MTTRHLKKLTDIQEKIKTLRDQEDKVQQELMDNLSQCLISAKVFDIDFDTLLGGILDLIDRIKTNSDQQKEAWKKSGKTFRQSRKNFSKPISKAKKIVSSAA